MRTPTSDFATTEYLPRLPSWSCATSVPRLRLQLEADHLELELGVAFLVDEHTLHVREVARARETTSELGSIVRITRQAFDLHDAVVLLERSEPKTLGIPARVVDGRRVVAAELSEHVGIDRRSVTAREHARHLEQHGDRAAARLLKLGDRLLARAK